ncbi:uncharacterized protein LOC123684151 [Harmonia axyridis]|uniref:uncharacterized protein LOC123684151 n=1 Tax=Harmonia axyridis TaxID=115357 RepID=UPI001E27879F|nr:uncharacterized protein LOC123684151 [Harmonia axyridis]
MNEKKKYNMMERLPAEIGNYLMRMNLSKALVFMDEAVKNLPGERYCLIGRATARTRSLNIEGATEDIETVLRLHPNDLIAHALKNDIEYLNLNFEKALVLNDKYLKRRKYPPHFFLGYMKCMDAILNSLAKERAGRPLRDHYEIIRKSAWIKNLKHNSKTEKEHIKKRKKFVLDSTTKLVETLKQIPLISKNVSSEITSESIGDMSLSTVELGSKNDESFSELNKRNNISAMIPKITNFPYKPLQQRTSNLSNYMSEKYLGHLHKHKCFLEKISQNKGFIAPNRSSEEKLKNLVKNVNIYLNKVQGLMRSTRPFYHIKYTERQTKYEALNTKDSLYRRQKGEAEQYFTKILYRLHAAYHVEDLKRIIVLVANMVDYYNARFPRSITNNQYRKIADAINVLRDGYFHFGLFSYRMSMEEKIDRVKIRLGMDMEKNPSMDSFFNKLRQHTSINWTPRIKILEEYLRKAQFPEEMIYFNYELAKLYLDLNKLEFVRSHAKKCMLVAKQRKDLKWVMNINFLLIQANIKQNNKMDSLKLLQRCSKLSKTLKCTELQEFLDFAMQLVQETDFRLLSGANAIIKERKQKILNLFAEDEKARRETDILFRKMSYTPLERTMPIIPGIKITPHEDKSKGIESESASFNNTTLKYVSKKPKKADERRGTAFYSLIKDYV